MDPAPAVQVVLDPVAQEARARVGPATREGQAAPAGMNRAAAAMNRVADTAVMDRAGTNRVDPASPEALAGQVQPVA